MRLLKQKIIAIAAILAVASTGLTACASSSADNIVSATGTAAAITINTANATEITLTGDTAKVTGDGAEAEDNSVKITKAGTYLLSGSYNGNIKVKAEQAGTVYLVLNDVTITSADKAAITCDSDLVVTGKASLTVTTAETDTTKIDGKDSIHSDAALTLTEADITAISTGDGFSAETALTVKSGTYNITTGGGSGAAPAKTSDKFGFGGGMNGTRGTAATTTPATTAKPAATTTQTVALSNTTATTTSVETAAPASGDTTENISDSKKGLKAGESLVIDGGTFTIDAYDDGIHSDKDTVINAGTFTISTGDDGIHANNNLTVNGGDINIPKCYEGLEGETVDITGGNIDVVSNDDALNAGTSSQGTKDTGNAGFERGIPPAVTDENGNAVTPQFNKTPREYATDENGNAVTPAHFGKAPKEYTTDENGNAVTPQFNKAPKEYATDENGNAVTPAHFGKAPKEYATDENGNAVRGSRNGTAVADGAEPPQKPNFDVNKGINAGRGMREQADENAYIKISGGNITAKSGGDTIDSNGSLEISGTAVLNLSGPSQGAEGVIDTDGTFKLNGGTLIAAGSIITPDEAAQGYAAVSYGKTFGEGSVIELKTADTGKVLLSYTARQAFAAGGFSSAELVAGTSYKVYVNGEEFDVTAK